jgi:uncharacterized protein (UPF0548 family)
MKHPRKFQLLPLVVGGISLASFVWLRRRWGFRVDEQYVKLDLPANVGQQNLPPAVLQGEKPVQFIRDGHGNLFVRRYTVNIAHSQLSADDLFHKIATQIDDFSAAELAAFEKTVGAENTLAVGDEFLVRISGPWNGPVRVSEVTPRSFSFVTLEDHLEAGEIQSSLQSRDDDTLQFRIQSVSRSKDAIVDIAYEKLKAAQVAQTGMWTFFCHKVVEMSGGQQVGEIEVATHEMPYEPAANVKVELPRWKHYESRLSALADAKLNFDLERRAEYTEINGWNLDNYRIELPSEAIGAPVKDGSFEQAKRVLLNYEFPDPTLVQGIFFPDGPLDKRVMIIEARWLIFTFMFGVRIGQVIDEERTDDELGVAQVWGYSYRTLEGHFETGEITFEIWKFLDSGKVEFRMHAYSKTGLIRNPFYRLGFAIFGRGLQRRFGYTALDRMQKIVIERLAGATPEATLDTPDIKPIRTDEAAQEKHEEAVSP